MSGAGSQMRVAPEGLSTSTRVVTSNVRHWSFVGQRGVVRKNSPGFRKREAC